MRTGCDYCDQHGPDLPTEAERHEAHRAFHDFGRTIMQTMVEPWAVPMVEWLAKRLA